MQDYVALSDLGPALETTLSAALGVALAAVVVWLTPILISYVSCGKRRPRARARNVPPPSPQQLGLMVCIPGFRAAAGATRPRAAAPRRWIPDASLATSARRRRVLTRFTFPHQENLSQIERSVNCEGGNWVYMAEGNLNVVFAYRGHNPELQSLVLRVAKVPREFPTCSLTWAYRRWWRRHLQAAFPVPCFNPGLPVRLLPPTLLQLDVSIRDIDLRLLSRRGQHLDCSQPTALLLPNCTLLAPSRSLLAPPTATLCIEIKPKAGVLQPCHDGDPARTKLRVCRYCMHQRLKLVKGETGAVSTYCPLNLFAGSRTKIQDALRSLFAHPQNNLRLFVDGTALDVARVNEVAPLLACGPAAAAAAAENDPPASGDGCDAEAGPSRACQVQQVLSGAAAHVLAREGVLRELRALQRLDDVGMETVAGLHAALQRAGLSHRIGEDAGQWLSQLRPSVTAAAAGGACRPRRRVSVPRDLDLLRSIAQRREPVSLTDREATAAVAAVQRFLVAASAKDCSIMMSLRESTGPTGTGAGDSLGAAAPPRPHSLWSPAARMQQRRRGGMVCEPATGRWFEYSVTVVDVDPKSPEKIPHYLRLDRRILECFGEHDHLPCYCRAARKGGPLSTVGPLSSAGPLAAPR